MVSVEVTAVGVVAEAGSAARQHLRLELPPPVAVDLDGHPCSGCVSAAW